MARRAGELGDDGVNDPKNWDKPIGAGRIHIGVSAFAIPRNSAAALSRSRSRNTRASRASAFWARQTSAPSPATSIRSATRTASISRRSRAAASSRYRSRTADQGRRVHPRYPGEVGFPLPMPQPDILGRNGTYVGFRNISRASAPSIDSSMPTEAPRRIGTGRRRPRWPLAQQRPVDARTGCR